MTWAPTARTQRTFASVFPHVLVFHDIHIGSNTPIRVNPKLVEARASEARPYFEAAGVDIVDFLRGYLAVGKYLGPDVERDRGDLNTDVFPRDELSLPF